MAAAFPSTPAHSVPPVRSFPIRFLISVLFALPLPAEVIIDTTNGNGGFVSASTGFNGAPNQWTAQRGVWIAGGNSSLTSSPFGADTTANSRYIQIHNDQGETLTSGTTFQVTAGDSIELSFDYFTSGSGNNTSLTVSLWDSVANSTYAILGTLGTSSPQGSFTTANYSTTASATNNNLRLRFTLTSAGGAGKDFNIDRVHLAGGALPEPAILWGAPFLLGNTPANVLDAFDAAKNGGGSPSANPTVVQAVNFGYGAVTVNGIGFTSSGGSTDFWGAGSTTGTPAGLDSSLDQLLSGHSAVAGTTTYFPITFTGLEIGKNYQVQIIVGHDNRAGLTGRQYEVSFGGTDFTSGGSPPVLTRGAQLAAGSFDTVVGSFMAAEPALTINLRSKGGLAANSDPAVSAYVLIGDPPPPLPPVEYATVHQLESSDTSSRIMEKAAKTLPRPNQVTWQRMEQTYFIHFGVNTFRSVEWGTGYENPTLFNPTALDASQWVREIKQAGGKQVLLVAKHHDGFCLWPSRYTAQDVASSPWLGGAGDVVRAVSDACQAQGLKFGVYVSPADLHQIHADEIAGNPEGYYGNGSANQISTIPTDPASFKTNPANGRAPTAGFGSHTYQVNDYNRYFLNQLYELLTEYGPVHQVWFDGANPEPGISETHDYAKWYDLIRKLKPDIVIGIGGDDARWVGNEHGTARETEWSVIPKPMADPTTSDLGSRSKLTIGSTLSWFPAEADVPILNGWFWSPSKTPKGVSSLLDIYYNSVGRNANLLLNLSPDTRGLIPDNQLASLRPFGQIVRNTFAANHVYGAAASAPADSQRPATHLLDGDADSFWESADSATTAELVLDLPAARTFDVVSLQEPIAYRGQRIEGFAMDSWDGSTWVNQAIGTTVGYKRLLKLPGPITTSRVRIRITACRLNPSLAEVGFFKEAVSIAAPTISNRNAQGMVAITGPNGLSIRYTIDGSEPGSDSTIYTGPVSLPLGGTVRAVAIGGDGLPGIEASRAFPGIATTGWIADADEQTQAAALAIDDNPDTIWAATSANTPHWLRIDMGAPRWISGFTYLPPAAGGAGTVTSYRFETSDNGLDWTLRSEGNFGNMANNPVRQDVNFEAVRTRWFRFTVTGEVASGTAARVAEFSVLPAGFDAWKRDLGQSWLQPGDLLEERQTAFSRYAFGSRGGIVSANRTTTGRLSVLLRTRAGLPDVSSSFEISQNLEAWTAPTESFIQQSSSLGEWEETQWSVGFPPEWPAGFARGTLRPR